MALPDIQIGVDGYCTMTHVEALNPKRTYSATSKPTRTNAAQYIVFEFDKINTLLDVLGYVIPVASNHATAISIVQHLNALAAASISERVTQAAGNLSESQHADELQRRFDMEWEDLEKGFKSLPGAPRQNNYIHKENEEHSQAKFHLKLDGATEKAPTFTKKMDW